MTRPGPAPTPPPTAGPMQPRPVQSVLTRIRRAPVRPAGERCEMCGTPVAEDAHSHVVDVAGRALLCTCRPCALLFDYPDAALRYKAVPNRYRRLEPLALPVWDDLQIPVGIAFFFRNSTLGRVVGVYPSPAGATESELPLGAWAAVVAAVPGIDLAADVEALLVRVTGSSVDTYLVPIDVCYELVGHLRLLWKGFDGGQDVRRRLAEFFATVEGRCR